MLAATWWRRVATAIVGGACSQLRSCVSCMCWRTTRGGGEALAGIENR